MATPVVEDIAVGLQTAIETITTGNGYEFNIGSVLRPRRKDQYTPDHLTAVIQQEDPEDPDEPLTEGNPAIRHWKQPYTVDVIVNPDQTENRAIDTVINEVRSDVEKAIAVAFASGGALVSFQRGFLIGPPVRFEIEAGGFEGIRMFVFISYATDENDPYTAR
jgi:hypothetical protein